MHERARIGEATAPVCVSPCLNPASCRGISLGCEVLDPEGMVAFAHELRKSLAAPVQMTGLNGRIDDSEFAKTALEDFDMQVGAGTVG